MNDVYEFRVVNKDGKQQFTGTKPLLDLSLAHAHRQVMDSSYTYTAPHSVQRRVYRANEWEDVDG